MNISYITKMTLLAATVLLWKHSAIWYAATDSLPYKIYWMVKYRQYIPEKHQMIAIYGHDTKYKHQAKFIKIVGGVAGDQINLLDDQIWINDQLIGKLKNHTIDHQTLTKIQSQKIPAGWVFVYATHKDSFDSRYQEFGLVNIRQVIGKVKPLW